MILLNIPPAPVETPYPVSALNALWVGSLKAPIKLPQWGQLLLVCPIRGQGVSIAGIALNPTQYLFLTHEVTTNPFIIQPLAQTTAPPSVLILWISPGFVLEMASFLGIPNNLQQLLQGVPLLQGDQLSELLQEIATACETQDDYAIVNDLFLEAVGDLLQQMRWRHQALLGLATHKQSTIHDLLPRLLQARQFVEAQYPHKIKTKDVANYVALSEFHFSRLFRTAFDMTLRQYIIRLRLDKARALLKEPTATVTETALSVGYTSLSSFIHAFRKQFGLSPSHYQAHIRT